MATRKTKTPATQAAPETIRMDEIERQMFYETIQQLTEAASVPLSAELRLAMEDQGWQSIGSNTSVIPEWMRTQFVRRARIAAQTDGLCGQIVNLYTNYCIGAKGVSWKCDDPVAQKVLDTFMFARGNECVLSPASQRQKSNEFQEDGEIYFALFAAPGQGVKIRVLDSLEISDIATEKEDANQPLYYVRDQVSMVGGSVKKIYYRDKNNTSMTPGYTPAGTEIPNASGELSTAVVYHVSLGGRGLRGLSRLLPVLDWARCYIKFMNARISIQQALARWAYKNKVRGNQATVTSMAAAVESHANKVKDWSGRQAEPGSIYFENQSAELAPMSQETGAAAAQVDGNMLLQNIGVGAGIFPHYFGAGEAFRLATATAMEGPMLKMFENYQGIWYGIWDAIFDFVLENAGIPKERRTMAIVLPRILPQSVTDFIAMLAAFPGMAQSEQVQAHALTLIGMNNPGDIIKALQDAGVALGVPTPVVSPLMGMAESADADTGPLDAFIAGVDKLLAAGGK